MNQDPVDIPRSTASSPSLPAAAIEALNSRPVEAPARCFVCLMDQEPTDPPSSWVDPCPCTIEAHQDCMLSWVIDCERSNKPLKCPVCKSAIEMEGSGNLAVIFYEAMTLRFAKASPMILASGSFVGILGSMQMYGAMAMWTFAGREKLVEFMLPTDIVAQNAGGVLGRLRDRLGTSPPFTNLHNTLLLRYWIPELQRRFVVGPLASSDWRGRGMALIGVAPALLISHFLPVLGNSIALPIASLYGMYHLGHEGDFLSWPPTPQLVMTIFPFIRAAYYNLWREFVLNYEIKLNRQILGLPPLEGNGRGARNNRRNAEQQGTILGMLQTLIDALGDEDEDIGHEHDDGRVVRRNIDIAGNGEAVVELVIEEIDEEELRQRQEEEGRLEGAHDEEHHERIDDRDDDEDLSDDDFLGREQEHFEADLGDMAVHDLQELDLPANNEDGEAALPELVAEPIPEPRFVLEDEAERPEPPPAQRPGLGTILLNVSSAIVNALLLPGISFAMGEALRLAVLPKTWTLSPGVAARRGLGPGLLREQWGRSLVGGCVYVVLKDALRVYAKKQKVLAMNNRRIKNVDRRRKK